MLRESVTWVRMDEAGEEDNAQSKRLITVKDEWFQAASEKQVSVLSVLSVSVAQSIQCYMLE